MAIASAALQTVVDDVTAATTTASKMTILVAGITSLSWACLDARGDENYPQARRNMAVIFADMVANNAEIATAMDANIA